MYALIMASFSACTAVFYVIVWIFVIFQAGKNVAKLHFNIRLHLLAFITTAICVFIGIMILSITVISTAGNVNVRSAEIIFAQCLTGFGCHALRAVMIGACFERYIATVKGTSYGTHKQCYLLGIGLVFVEVMLGVAILFGQVKLRMPFYCTHIEMVVVQVLDITSVRYLIRVNRSLRRVQFGLAKNYNAVQNLRLLLVFEPHIILHTVFSLLSFATSLVAFCLGVPWLNQMFSFYPVYCLFFLFDGMLALYQLHRVKILAMLANKIPDNDSSLVNTRNVKVVDCFGKVIPTQVSSEQHFVELQKAWI